MDRECKKKIFCIWYENVEVEISNNNTKLIFIGNLNQVKNQRNIISFDKTIRYHFVFLEEDLKDE